MYIIQSTLTKREVKGIALNQQTNSAERLKIESKDWIARLNRGLTASEKQQLVAWINSDRNRISSLESMKTSTDDLSALYELNGLFLLNNEEQTTAGIERLWPSISGIFFAILLVFAAILAFSNLDGVLEQSSKRSQYLVSTTTGETKKITLEDGTTVLINTNTLLSIKYSDSHRKVELLKGEAEFDIVTNLERPFSVISGSHTFTALGTIFSVEKQNEADMELVVTEGKVLVADSNLSLNQLRNKISQAANSQLTENITHAGELTLVNNNKITTEKVTNETVSAQLAWQHGAVVFDGVYLIDALQEVSRYNQIQFEITDPQLSNVKISGYFKFNDIDTLLFTLSEQFNIDYLVTTTNSIQLSSRT